MLKDIESVFDYCLTQVESFTTYDEIVLSLPGPPRSAQTRSFCMWELSKHVSTIRTQCHRYLKTFLEKGSGLFFYDLP